MSSANLRSLRIFSAIAILSANPEPSAKPLALMCASLPSDIGYHGAGVMVWAVLAPTADPAKGVLSGTYVGVTGGAHVGVGASGNLLIGGSDKTVTLQPLSIEGATGLNVAAGLAGLSLTAS